MKRTVMIRAIPLKLILILISAILLVSCAGGTRTTEDRGGKTSGARGTQPGETQPKVADYFPFIENLHMAYKGIGNEYAEYKTYVEYIKDNIMQVRNLNPGTNLAVVYEIKNGELRRVLNRGEVYHRYDYTALKDDKEEVLLKEPIKVGTLWELKDGTKRSITSLDKEISTPLGNYTALEVTSDGPYSVITDYYVKDIGYVKRIFKSKEDDFTVTSELEKIERNVPYKERIRIYFPDFNNDKVAYINSEIAFLTNQDVEEVLEKAMKQVPEGSGLTGVFSDNTRILDIALDDNNDMVTVDLSSHFVTEMNAGTSLESMILKSVVNTFGEYFQKTRVKIKLEGKPYSSGHMLMGPDDYFTVDTENTYEFK
ncbi:MAG: GerMN domain-containing protein [Clostridiaceae bacterium]|nr:GerMN domain-containing protein [Clostridiaceae bacterium]